MRTRAELAKGWFLKGDSDLNTARTVLATAGPYDTACFHAQQAVEKYLKGLLDYHGRPYPLIHDLGKLALLCEGVEPPPGLSMQEVAALTDYAVSLRYDSEFWPDLSKAADAVRVAGQVQTAILAVLPAEARP
jgi:HEPN domain-containing protein